MSQENVQLVQRVLGHWAATGELLWDTTDPQIEVHDHDAPDQGDYRGQEGVRLWLDDWGAAWAEWSIDLDEFIDAGNRVVIFIRMKAQGRGSGIENDRRRIWASTSQDPMVRTSTASLRSVHSRHASSRRSK
jgi:hypothetical protein